MYAHFAQEQSEGIQRHSSSFIRFLFSFFLLLSLYPPFGHHLITQYHFIQGVMYLENNLCDELYNNNHVDLLKVLTSQMAISLENIRFLHDQMEKQSEQIRYTRSKHLTSC